MSTPDVNKDIQGFESFSLEDLSRFIQEHGLPRFRNKQLVQWVYSHGATSYDDMTNLPAKMRFLLSREVPLNIPTIVEKRVSKDASRKYVLALHDGLQVETVGIPSNEVNAQGVPKRLTVCFSTQVGCPMQCAFCATGKEGFTRNLLPGEMAQQILAVQRDFGLKVTNVVAMGQGEPFLNYSNVIEALHIINHPDALNIGARHITVSTCGIVSGIDRFATEPEQFTLAISLHAARQEVRDSLMPQCRNMNLTSLKDAVHSYYELSRRRTTFEYMMIDKVNDTEEDLAALITYCRALHVHINLIPLNDIDGSKWVPSSKGKIQYWLAQLNKAGIEASLRNSRGADIDGACGQLKNKVKDDLC